MSILTLFVVIPVVMLLGLWLSRNLNQVRGVMVAGSTALLLLSIWLTVAFVQARNAGNTDVMLFTYSTPWFRPLNIASSVGVDGISVVMLLLSSIIVFTGTFASWQLKPMKMNGKNTFCISGSMLFMAAISLTFIVVAPLK